MILRDDVAIILFPEENLLQGNSHISQTIEYVSVNGG